jgi:two-component system CheB/CheR fusion protein
MTTDAPDPDPPAVPIAVIGASAGGLEALRALFGALAPDTGIAFIVVQHRIAGHDQLLADLIARSTPMPVATATDGATLRADHVLIAPAGRRIDLDGGVLRISAPGEDARTPIDHAMRAAAGCAGTRAIGVVLSGSGADGTQGLRALRRAGGLALVQDPATASVAAMPNAAIAAGVADQVLTPEHIAQRLAAFADRLRTGAGDDQDRQRLLDEIVGLLLTQTKTYFHDYKRRTLVRRIERRMEIHGLSSLGAYRDMVRDAPNEARALANDLMLSVTKFFRDPDSFDVLRREALAPLMRAADSHRPLRVWVPGCATGEEAYTIAMLAAESAGLHGKEAAVRIFATDIDERALETARAGRYPASIAADVSPERLARFFVADGAEFVARKELREQIVFARHNALADPPFSQLDLISCRNMLIYTEAQAQRRLAGLFHFALNPGGFLFLGSAETPSCGADLFEPVSAKHRLYRRFGTARGRASAADGGRNFGTATQTRTVATTEGRTPAEIMRQALLAEFAPPSVLVDGRGQALYFHGQTGDILDIPAGEPRTDLLAMTSGDLRVRLREGLDRARHEPGPVVIPGVRTAREGRQRALRLVIVPLRGDRSAANRQFAVSFVPETEIGPPAPVSAEQEPMVERLERELRIMRDDLESSIQDLAAANEALLTANEEVTSVNEELQSSNEELETSKEELQSLNEELTTVNVQLQEKVSELEATSNDLNNLLDSSDVATVILDTERRIRRFTPAATRHFALIPSDIGRPITDVARRYEDPGLIEDIARVEKALVPVDAQVAGPEDTALVRRILTYRTAENRIDGVVITFADISASVRAGVVVAMRAHRDSAIADIARSALAAAPEAALFAETLARVAEVLDADIASILAVRGDDMVEVKAAQGRCAAAIDHVALPLDPRSDLAQAATLRSGLCVRDYAREPSLVPHEALRAIGVASGLAIAFGGGAPLALMAHDRRARHFAPEDQRFLQAIASVLGLALDRLRAERAIADALDLTEDLVDTQPMPTLLIDAKGRIASANAAYQRLFAVAPAAMPGRSFQESQTGIPAELRDAVQSVRETGAPVMGLAIPVPAAAGSGARVLHADIQRLGRAPDRILVTIADAGRLDEAAQRLNAEKEAAERALAAKTRFLAAASHDLRQPLQGAVLFQEIAERRNRDPAVARALGDLGHTLDAMRDMLDMLLDISRLDAGIVEPRLARVDLGAALGRLAAEFQPQAQAAGLTLRVVQTRATVWTDPRLLDRILRNLIANALRYTPSGRILVGGRRRHGAIAVQVWDTGRGVPAEQLAAIFEEFHQLDNPARERSKGLGLGLAVVRRLASLLGHPIDVRSRPDRGSVFEIHLALAPAVASQPVPALLAARPDAERRVVIVVEDDPLVLAGLCAALEDQGYTPVALDATGAIADAIARLDPASIRCAISDYRLPGPMTGVEVLLHLREILGPRLPCLLLTGDTASERLKEAQASGFRLLSKPVGIEQITAAVDAAAG